MRRALTLAICTLWLTACSAGAPPAPAASGLSIADAASAYQALVTEANRQTVIGGGVNATVSQDMIAFSHIDQTLSDGLLAIAWPPSVLADAHATAVAASKAASAAQDYDAGAGTEAGFNDAYANLKATDAVLRSDLGLS